MVQAPQSIKSHQMNFLAFYTNYNSEITGRILFLKYTAFMITCFALNPIHDTKRVLFFPEGSALRLNYTVFAIKVLPKKRNHSGGRK